MLIKTTAYIAPNQHYVSGQLSDLFGEVTGVTVQTVFRNVAIDLSSNVASYFYVNLYRYPVITPDQVREVVIPLGKEYSLWIIVYVAAYLGHRQKQESAIVRVPTLLWIICGKPLPNRQLQLLPLVLQLSMFAMLLSGVARFTGLIGRRLELIVVALCLLGSMIGSAYAVISFQLRNSNGAGHGE